MPRRSRNHGVLAGWLFADLALMLAFVFLDSSASGGVSPLGQPSSTTTTTVSTTTTTRPPTGADPTPINIVVPIRLSKEDPSKLIENWRTFQEALNGAINRSDSEAKKATTFLVVMVRVGSKDTDRQFAGPLARDLAQQIRENWTKVQRGVTYFDTGDDASLEVGLVRLKLFPVLD